MDKLEPLPNILRLSQRVLTVLGQNPGKFTLQGTNTYLVGTRPPFILVDTGEGKPEYIPLLASVLKEQHEQSPSVPLVSDIVITHKHGDHHGGLPSVLSLLRDIQSTSAPRIHKFPLEGGDLSLGSVLAQIPPGTFTPTGDGRALHDLSDGQELDGTESTLRVIHTPGHTADSICLFLPEEEALLTADTVLGQGTAVFEDLGTYMRSLRLIHALDPSFTRIYPGHGPAVVQNAREHVQTYITHRQAREDEIVKLLNADAEKKDWSAQDVVQIIYAKYPQSLWPAATHGILLHLAKLQSEGRVAQKEVEGVAHWSLV
ncbi:Metallo-hydrolase/oxidoreductase [Exidia glandulosa HHB12029]|uniref:Metallo-hydrolase/oxidoreductase n=1 Tax=Exidia glandulosa HHB12029 TaxID=1314781 RepID=A0A165CZE3_EXIGL|nr:Metallo-hydrolase/oxidoreductase [Exidia glandulosa HHB12029]